LRVARVDPRLEIRGRQVRKSQQQIAEIALGVDADGRHAIDGGLFEQRKAQARLARARHPHAHGVRGQVLRVVQDQVVLERVRGWIVFTTQVEHA
jgi:hypothetical protein